MAKEVKKVKCKKCRLTYDKKLYECPYCHKNRFNPTGLIIFLIILVIAGVAAFYFKGDEIIGAVKKMNNVTTFEKNEVTYTITDIQITDSSLSDGKYIKLNIEVENKSESEAHINCVLSAYEDGYLSSDMGSHNLYENLVSGTKMERSYTMSVKNDWNEVIIYGKFNGESVEMFKIYNTEKGKQ